MDTPILELSEGWSEETSETSSGGVVCWSYGFCPHARSSFFDKLFPWLFLLWQCVLFGLGYWFGLRT